MNVRVWIDCTVADGTDLDELADKVADLVGTDLDDACPEIITTDNWGAEATDGTEHRCATMPCPFCDLRSSEPPGLAGPLTVCEPCDAVVPSDVHDHLAAVHPDLTFEITTDPATGLSTIHRQLPEPTDNPG